MKTEKLNIQNFIKEAEEFAKLINSSYHSNLYGVTYSKVINTYLKSKFKEYIGNKNIFDISNSWHDVDFPCLNTNINFTNIKSPYSSYPYKSAREKIYGLDYNLILFIYNKTDDHSLKSSKIKILSITFIEKDRTADYKTTKGLLDILKISGNKDDLLAFMMNSYLLANEMELNNIADHILTNPPKQGDLNLYNTLH